MKRFNIIITLSATLGLFSCELDKMPMDQVSDAVFWQSRPTLNWPPTISILGSKRSPNI